MSLQIGIIGTGWFAKMHAEILSRIQDVQVSAVCGTSKDKAVRLAEQFNEARAYDSVLNMLDARKLDAVYICVPPFAHGDMERMLVQQGIPFFVEKPLGVDLARPSEIARLVQEKQLLTSVGYHFRYMDSTTRAKELLAERTVGMAIGRWLGSMPEVPWWRKQEGSGGQFIEQTTHIVDLLRYLLGEVNEVYAAYAHRIMQHKHDNVTVPDVGTVTLKLASGAVASISNASMLQAGSASGLDIYTDKGNLELSQGGLLEVAGEKTLEHKNASNPYENETRAFLHALRTGDASGIRSTYADAWRTQQITVAAGESAASGQPVKLQSN